MIVGALLLAPIGGALLGVGVGALIGKLTDAGLSDDWIREVSDAIPAGGSSLFLLVNFAKRDVVFAEVRNAAVGGKIINATLSDEAGAAFKMRSPSRAVDVHWARACAERHCAVSRKAGYSGPALVI